ncbi:CapA family protein [Planotetraspora thailandica]|uniref:CapA family protein n=1 Tax=Planotetraspora thailandica TaxID=487172 RepID=UPI001EF39585|nr:CapA family protein [Planotetraspora thailandica]
MTLFLCGDVMLGRGVDQILPRPGDSALREMWVRDARAYVELAEAVNGPISRPVGFSWPWGDALRVLDAVAPDVRVLNLETSVTRSDEFAPGKAVHYRMSPDNLGGLTVARPDVCALANNHVLDFGRRGLRESLDALTEAGLTAAGAGRDARQAWRPAAVPLPGGGRALIFSFGTASSGIPPGWAAADDQAGLAFVLKPSDAAAADVVDRVSRAKRPGDIVVASIHWGTNWGYSVPAGQIRFAHALVDGAVDVVHGHSSHHPRPIEVYRDKLILYGCGDFIDDYEGIAGYEEYRDDLRLMYFASLQPRSGNLTDLRIVPMQARQMRLRHAVPADRAWLRGVVDRVSRSFGTRIALERDET